MPARPPVYYPEYLQLDKVLSSQTTKSGLAGAEAHDELLFIIVHQTYELWFKQILHELVSVAAILGQDSVDDRGLGTIVARFTRVGEIQRVLIDQLQVLETMTPLDFLDFRDHLVPASGFQSAQFRRIEILLGLQAESRTKFSRDAYRTRLKRPEQEILAKQEANASIFDHIEAWLERTPFLNLESYSFWAEYEAAVGTMLAADRDIIENNPGLSDDGRTEELDQHKANEDSFRALFDEAAYEELRTAGKRRLSYGALRAALFIHLYRDYPALQLPHRILSALVDVDELFTTWRLRHALLAHRMLGQKIGTGGSAGHRYLRSAAEKHKVFGDFFDLTTYLVPRSALPTLPADVERQLGFAYKATS